MSSAPPSELSSGARLIRQLFSVRGMTCRSCELLIEQNLQKVAGITDVRASERRAEVEVYSTKKISLAALQKALAHTSYVLGTTRNHELTASAGNTTSPQSHLALIEVGGMLIFVLALYQLLTHFHVLTVPTEVQGVLGTGAIFSIGLVAAFSSCMAMVGGLLLTVSAKWAETHKSQSRLERFQPLLAFNAGRLAGYFLFGGIIGAIGTVFTLSTPLKGALTIVIAVIMLMLGLNILHILPKRYCSIPLPRGFQNRIGRLTESKNPLMPIGLGALTFFVPCGFTQSMQVLALGSGSFFKGAAIMFIFALGTLPSLLGISILSSVLDGRKGRIFLQFAGSVAVILGMSQLNSGLLLSGVNAAGALDHILFSSSRAQVTATDPTRQYVSTDAQNRQILAISVSDQGFSPALATIRPGFDTWVYAYAAATPYGCASTIVAPVYGASTPVVKGGNWMHIGYPTKDFQILCSMAMLRMDVKVSE
ncbi:MAG: hypothetical protein JWM56_831 [Candidatus Peribacteria bacterium]|nr:hypothetical protein [Candidatus Peribacteria bacterium]